jgi:hypothetical protein
MSGLCRSTATRTAQVAPSNPIAESVYPISLTVWRTTCGKSIFAVVVISPATTTIPVLASDSHATRARESCSRIASRIASDT